MRFFLLILAVPCGLFAVGMMASAFLKGGSDLQLIGSGVFLTVLAVCLGFAGTLQKLERDRAPIRDTGHGLAKELLAQWDSMASERRTAIARDLIRKLDSTAGEFLETATESQLKERLTTLRR